MRSESLLLCALLVLFVAVGATGQTPDGPGSEIHFSYEGQSESLIEIVPAGSGIPSATIMLGPDASDVRIPVDAGVYRLNIGSVEDLTFSGTREVRVGASEPVTVSIDEPELSGAATVEEHRDTYFRASAVEASMAFQRRSRGRVRWIALGAGLISGAGATYAYLEGQDAYSEYSNAATTSAAADARSRMELSTNMAIGLGAGAVTGFLVGVIAQLLMPDISDARANRREAEAALAEAEQNQNADSARAAAEEAIERELGE